MSRVQARVTTAGVIAAQIVAGLGLAAWLWAGGDGRAGYSVLAGLLAGVVPNFFFALKLFGLRSDADARSQLRAIYAGETVKVAFASMLLASAIAFLPVSLAYLLAGFLATVVVSWCALAMPLNGEQRR
jgi:F0F1-type ATP synthase assembly protein I